MWGPSKLLKFQYQTSLFKFTALSNRNTEGPKKLKKIYETSFRILKKNWKILVAGYFDDLIIMNSTNNFSAVTTFQRLLYFYQN